MKVLSHNRQERMIAAIIVPPIAVLLNYFVFGGAYFESCEGFLLATFITMLVVLIVYMLCSMVATILLNRFPKSARPSSV